MLMLVTGCASYPTAHLEPRISPNFDNACNESFNVQEHDKISRLLPMYRNPSNYFFSSEKSVKEADSDAIFESAKSLGQKIGAFDAENEFWNKTLLPVSGQLDVIYNYRSIMFANMVIPKRLIIHKGGVVKDDNIITFNGMTLEPVGEFSIVTPPPTWRDFFPVQQLHAPRESVNSFDLTTSNLKLWNNGLSAGYRQGVCLTLLDYKQALKNLESDFTQRFAYAIAAKRGVTKPPSIHSIKVPMESSDGSINLDSIIYKVDDNGNFESTNTWGDFK